MSADAFEKNNFGWQMQQQQQRFGEWLELQQQQFGDWLERLFPKSNLSQPSLPSWLINLLQSFPDWAKDLIWLLLRVTFWVLLAALLSWLAVKLLRLVSPYYSSLRFQRQNAAKIESTATLDSVQGWLRRSQEFYRQGNYREACRALYLGMLQKLHDTGIAPHQASRTDGEYRQIVGQMPQEESYQTLLTTHERSYFGNADISAEVFEQCQQAYRNIDAIEAKS